MIYRQAFDLFNALTKEQKELVSNWRTNVEASVDAELCEKLRPICELMHQASAVTNCDWGIEPITFETKMPHLLGSRNIARAAIWNAAHCRSNDVVGATDDILSALRVGHNVSQSALLGCLVDMAVQGVASSYIAQNLGTFRGADNQRLVAAINDPANAEAPGLVMAQEADRHDRQLAKLSSLPAGEAKKQLAEVHGLSDANHPDISPELFLVDMKQVADSERELAKALASSSEDEVEAWHQHSTELQTSNPLAEELVAYDQFVAKVRAAAVNRAMVVAGLAVAENGTEALAAHLDPSSGKPFVYTETDDGFELQSAFVFIDKPYKIRFK